MQVDMHYYGTCAIAKAVGIPDEDAQILAYSSQYVDDSTRENCQPEHSDGSLLVSMTTSHHLAKCIAAGLQEPDYQRKVWIPNHFIPGGEGIKFEEKILCVKNSEIANTMFDEHIKLSVNNDQPYQLELLGIAAHAYMDTFSHYGFSGISSSYNFIENNSIKFINDDLTQQEKERLNKKINKINKMYYEKDANILKKCALYIKNFFTKTTDDNLLKNAGMFIKSFIAEETSGALGHGAVLSLPDQPYLKWKFKFEKDRANNNEIAPIRDNQSDYLEALECLYTHLYSYAEKKYLNREYTDFSKIKDRIRDILSCQGEKETRSEEWISSGLLPKTVKKYDEMEWENKKNTFNSFIPSSNAIQMPVYKFHQAAAYHRYYMLKDLLPRFGIAVY